MTQDICHDTGRRVPPERAARQPQGTGRSSVFALALATVALGLAACTNIQLSEPTPTEGGMKSAGKAALSGAEVNTLLNRPQRYRWTTAAGASGYTQISPNGRVRTYWDSDAVNGQIRFTDTGYCTRYEGVRNNREDCYRLYRVTPTQYQIYRADGTFSGLIDLER